jgi:uncharacterized damage-inducible protein DinB
MSRAKRISDLLRSTFEKNAWYGPAVMEVLADVTPEQATKNINGSNSIIELVGHMTAWRTFTIKKLEGDSEFDIENDEMNFPSSNDWELTLQGIKESQNKLLLLLESISEEKISEMVPGRKYNFQTLLHGVIQHDIYHLGQIQLIKKYG